MTDADSIVSLATPNTVSPTRSRTSASHRSSRPAASAAVAALAVRRIFSPSHPLARNANVGLATRSSLGDDVVELLSPLSLLLPGLQGAADDDRGQPGAGAGRAATARSIILRFPEHRGRRSPATPCRCAPGRSTRVPSRAWGITGCAVHVGLALFAAMYRPSRTGSGSPRQRRRPAEHPSPRRARVTGEVVVSRAQPTADDHRLGVGQRGAQNRLDPPRLSPTW